MKILNILNENTMFNYRDLTPMQSAVVNRIATGKITYEGGSQREQMVMDELADLGYLVPMSDEFTDEGRRLANMITKHGGYDVRKALARPGQHSEPAPARKYSDVGDASDMVDGDGMAGVTGRGLGLNSKVSREDSI